MSPYLARKRMKSLHPVETQLVDMCRKGCRLYKQDSEDTECEHCHMPRYDETMVGKVPYKQLRILPLGAQITALLSNDRMRELLSCRVNFCHQHGVYNDIFAGRAYRKLQSNGLFDGVYDIAIALFVDGFQPFDSSQVSMTIVHAVIFNFPPSKRYAQPVILNHF